jgi:predicted metallopeptidase
VTVVFTKPKRKEEYMPRGRKKSNKPKEEKLYRPCEEANAIVKELADRYDSVLWTVNPNEVAVFTIDNVDKPASNKTLAKITHVSNIYKALLEQHNVKVKYLIEIYGSDWGNWNATTKQWVLFHELLHVPAPNTRGLIKHDVQDFALTVDVVGLDMGYEENDKLPNLLLNEPVQFRKELVDRMHALQGELPEDEN